MVNPVVNKIIPAADRTAAPRGAKVLIIGPTGVGKTSLLRTIDPTTTLLVDVEAGDLAVTDIAVDTFRPRTWAECRDLAVVLAGPNPAVPADNVYSAAHYTAVKDQFGDPAQFKKYKTFFIDSITAIGRLCFQWATMQPEAFSERSGKKDLRGAYGLHAREALALLMHIQQARDVNVVLLGVLETATDEFRHTEHRLQFEGARTGRELPAVVDEVITYHWVDFGDGAPLPPLRTFICTSPNNWNYPAKDRSGKLEQFEPPDLGKLLNKLTKPRTAASSLPQPSSKSNSTAKVKG
jgi:energy-coupling factor transporter ATP-binding protein EcfA2